MCIKTENLIFLLTILFCFLFFVLRKQGPLLKDRSTKYKVRLISKEKINHNVYRLVFEVPYKLGLNIGQHIKVYYQDKCKSYSPTCDRDNAFELIVKDYGSGFSNYLCNLNIFDKIEISGPFGLHSVECINDNFSIKNKKGKTIIMIACGSGITPFLRIIKEYSDNNIELFYSNRTESDIICKSDLPINTKHFITSSGLRIQKNDLYYNSDALYLICGTNEFNKTIKDYLLQLMIPDDKIFLF